MARITYLKKLLQASVGDVKCFECKKKVLASKSYLMDNHYFCSMKCLEDRVRYENKQQIGALR